MADNEDAASNATQAPPRWLADIVETAEALRELAGAQWHLLGAELRLARAAAMTLFITVMAAVACMVALGLTLLALLGVGLALWFGSWIWSLVGLAIVLILVLTATLLLARRCLHWLSLPGTRAQWHSLAHAPAAPPAQGASPDGEASSHAHSAQTP